jgi:hypothetical protein
MKGMFCHWTREKIANNDFNAKKRGYIKIAVHTNEL